MKRRDANLILVAIGAFGGGAIMLSLPPILFERTIERIGVPLSPQLGWVVYLLFVAMGAALCALLVASILPWRRRDHAFGRGEGTIMSFLFSGIASFARGGLRKGRSDLEYYSEMDGGEGAPVLRRSDAHPDAPARAPLFARRDLGEEALPPVEDSFEVLREMAVPDGRHEAPFAVVRDITGLSMPRAPEPLPWELIEQEMNRVLKGAQFYTHPDVVDGESADDVEDCQPGIADLADRLEKGLARRRIRLAGDRKGSSPMVGGPASSPLPVSPLLKAMKDVTCAMPVDDPKGHGWHDDFTIGEESPDDEGLERALDALRSITRRAGQDKVA